jgi:hypothetical protein
MITFTDLPRVLRSGRTLPVTASDRLGEAEASYHADVSAFDCAELRENACCRDNQ